MIRMAIAVAWIGAGAAIGYQMGRDRGSPLIGAVAASTALLGAILG